MTITNQLAIRRQRQRKKKTTHLHRTTICDLPQHTISDILARLPIWTAVHSMTLCKTIHASVLDDPQFAVTQFLRSSKTLSLIYPPTFDLVTGGFMYLVDEHITGGRLSAKRSMVGKFTSDNFPTGALEVMGSCNGLLLCLSRNLFKSLDDGVFVCNPIRRCKWVKLPKASIESTPVEFRADYGLGFCSVTNLYKVMRIVHTDSSNGSTVIGCEVLRLGSNQWRCIGDVPFNGRFRLSSEQKPSPWITCNGALHTLVKTTRGRREELSISCFKIHEEELKLLVPVPIRDHYENVVTLGMLRDCLTLFNAKNLSQIDIWVMNDYGVKESWTKTWVIESNILKGLGAAWLKPIKFREDGELLMSYVDHTGFAMVCYDPANSTVRKHKLHGIEYCERIDYVPSFLSPKDVIMGGD